MDQLSTVGFLVLTNIEGYSESRLLDACVAFHALPPELKRTLYLRHDNPVNSNRYRGYMPFKPNDASHKEMLDMGEPLSDIPPDERTYPLYEETPFPTSPELVWIREVFETTRRVWMAAAIRVIRLLAEGLGKPAGFFDPWFLHGTLSTFRSIHYLPRSAGVVDSHALSADEVKLTTPEHADSGFLTFLATFGSRGLQVLTDGVYQDVLPVPAGTLVVNLGDVFARITGWRLKATFHRVLDIGCERFSCPLFIEPKYSARIPSNLLSPTSSRKSVDEDIVESDILYGDWLVKRIMEAYVEWRDFEVPPARAAAIAAIDSSAFVLK